MYTISWCQCNQYLVSITYFTLHNDYFCHPKSASSSMKTCGCESVAAFVRACNWEGGVAQDWRGEGFCREWLNKISARVSSQFIFHNSKFPTADYSFRILVISIAHETKNWRIAVAYEDRLYLIWKKNIFHYMRTVHLGWVEPDRVVPVHSFICWF